jgi:MGT family glycosyltransferase
MSHILICVTPVPGSVNPMLAVAAYLQAVGHSIIFNTGAVFRDRIEASGIPFVPFTGLANYDYRQLETTFPDRQTLQSGSEQLIFDFKHLFGDVIPEQDRGIQQILATSPVDLILTDISFWGTLPLLLGARELRPLIIGCGVSPVLLSSQDVSLLSLTTSAPNHRDLNRRDRQENVNDYLDNVLVSCGAAKLPAFFLDVGYILPDRFFQFTATAFEFPRSDLPDTIEFVGAIRPNLSTQDWEPDWWLDLDRARPIVLVTQGTAADTDLSKLIEPTLLGLADEDLSVIVSTDGIDPSKIAVTIPDNARVTSFIPFEAVLPEVNVFITNGGYGGVQQSLSLGIPVVVAGATDAKSHVAARVAWSGAGLDLATARPTPAQIKSAVRDVLNQQKYRIEAQRLRQEFATYNALDRIGSRIDTLIDPRYVTS